MLRNYGSAQLFVSSTIAMAFVAGMLWLMAWIMSPLGEDDPGWNCFAHGNRICGEPASESMAWDAFDGPMGDASLGALAEIVDMDRPYRVEYVGVALIRPDLGRNLMAVHWEDGRWYVFRATNTDKSLTKPDKA